MNSVALSVDLADLGLTHADGTVALAGIDLRIGRGERVAIIGPSGAGKTTLLRLLATGLQPDCGGLNVLGCDPWALSTARRQKLRARIGLIQQAPALPPRQRVVTAVSAGRLGQWSLGRSLLNLVYPLDGIGVRDALARLDLADKLFARCAQLSGGQLQRVAIARALYQAPELILADEPVSSLDPTLAGHVLGVLIREAERRGIALIASLHAVELALQQFQRVIGLRDGRIVFDRPAGAVTAAELEALYANAQLQPGSAAPDRAAVAAVVRLPWC